MATQLELERSPLAEGKAGPKALPGIKSILLHVQNDASLDRRLDDALALARACDAHLSCLHVTPIEAYTAFDSFGGVFILNDYIKALDEEESKVRTRVGDRLRDEDVRWDYEQITGNVTGQIVRHSALADLVVTGRDPHPSDLDGPAIGLLGDLLYRARTPLFVPGDETRPCDPTGAAIIAWDGSYEAANAVRSAIGLLRLASEVRIVQIREAKEDAFPGTRLLEYLSRHEIHADLHVESSGKAGGDPQFIAGHLISCAEALNAAVIVMGGYNHSRLGEYVFGGVTRTMLAGSPVPLLIAH